MRVMHVTAPPCAKARPLASDFAGSELLGRTRFAWHGTRHSSLSVPATQIHRTASVPSGVPKYRCSGRCLLEGGSPRCRALSLGVGSAHLEWVGVRQSEVLP